MTELGSGLVDTSVFIARETNRALGELRDRVAVSVVTIGGSDDYDRMAAAHPDLRVIKV